MNHMLAVRTRLKLSQNAMGGKLGLRQATVSRMEAGLMLIDQRTRLAIRQVAADAGVALPSDFFEAPVAEEWSAAA